MFKGIFVAVLIVVIITLGSSFLSNSTSLLSPLAKKSESPTKDDIAFEQVKSKVQTKPFSWAMGDAKSDDMVQDANYIVVDKSGKVLFARNADEKRSPASLTKIVTAMVVLDTVKMNDVLTVPKSAVGIEPTTLLVDEGEKLAVAELMEAMLLTSTNDAAETLAVGIGEKLGGTRNLFIKLMNEKVKNLGLKNTNFANPMGYDDPNQYSTARDLAVIAQYAMENYPDIKRIVKKEAASIVKTDTHKKYELPNWNSLLGVYPGVDGIKIGNTDEAKHTTIVTSTRGSERIMVVLLGAPDRRARDFWAADLLNSAFVERGIKPFRVTLWMLQSKSNDWSDQLIMAKDENAGPYAKPVQIP